jgi:acetate kinase
MAGALVVLNAGSSSLKFSVYLTKARGPVRMLGGKLEALTAATRFVARDLAGKTIDERRWRKALGHEGAIHFLLEFLRDALAGQPIAAVGHRVVHGGAEFLRPVRIDARVLAKLERLVPLAPLHQPHNLAPIRALLAHSPKLLQVACFDTSFHRTMPPVEQAFALPESIVRRGVRRYGFHGLSYEYIAGVLPRFDADAAAGRTIVAHLGNGASMCAMRAGKSIATTMGFTAVDGLVMGTRSGALDPGVVLYCIGELGMDARAVERLLYEKSGLLGVSGVSGDMRTLLASKEPRAAFAVELFCYRITRELGSLTATVGGLDAFVFTGGIGENAAPIRRRVLKAAGWLGLTLDATANAKHGPRISADGPARAWVIPTDEELMIARHTQQIAG